MCIPNSNRASLTSDVLQTARPDNPELAPARASASTGGGYSARGSSAYGAMNGMGAMGMGMGGMGERPT